MSTKEKAVLERFKQLLAARTPLRQVILFGSRARGDADPLSDFDVVVILEDSAGEKDLEAVSDCAWEAGYEQGMVIVPVTFTRREWEQGPQRASLLAQAVRAEGIPL